MSLDLWDVRSKNSLYAAHTVMGVVGQLASCTHTHSLSGRVDWSLQVLAEGAQLIGCGIACQARHDPSC